MNPEVVAFEARRAARRTVEGDGRAYVIPLATSGGDGGRERPAVLDDLSGAHRPLPDVSAYDDLLTHRTRTQPLTDPAVVVAVGRAPLEAGPPHDPVIDETGGDTAGQEGEAVS